MINRAATFHIGAAVAGALTPLNSSIIAVALPQVRSDFHVGMAEATLLVSAYLIAVAVAQPVAGRAGDAFGHERMICLGLAGTILLCGLAAAAWTFPVLVIARIVQGMSAAFVAANVMAAIRAGIITPTTKAEMERAEEAVAKAQRAADAPKPDILLPRARERWERIVANLADHVRHLPAARDTLRAMIGEAVVRNENGDLVAEIAGSSQIALVAGAGFGRYLTGPIRIPLTERRG